MTVARRLPRLFVGSSVEGLDLVYALQENLEFDAGVTVWSQGLFDPSAATLNALLKCVEDFEFAVMVFSADDVVRFRDSEFRAARDNVIFELGLFYGRLGTERCFFVVPRGITEFRLPTDLLGILPLSYSAARSDGNLVAAFATAANQIRRTIRKALQTEPIVRPPELRPSPFALEDFIATWNGPAMQEARAKVRSMPLGAYGPERDALGKVFALLESLSDAVLSGSINEQDAHRHFGEAVPSVWSVAFHELSPPNHADEWWEPLPKIAQLSERWKK
jgi:hypothetical protein